MRKFFLIICILLAAFQAQACTVCFKGDPTQTANVAARSGVLMMLALVVVVLGLFAWFFIQLVLRSKQSTQEI